MDYGFFSEYYRFLSRPIFLKGKGLHSGEPVSLAAFPYDVPGLHFLSLSQETMDFLENISQHQGEQDVMESLATLLKDNALCPVPASFSSVVSTHLATTLGYDEKSSISMVEHLLAACFVLGLEKCLFCISGHHMPILDGGSKDYGYFLEQGHLRESFFHNGPKEKRHWIYSEKEFFYTPRGLLISKDHWNGEESFVHYKPSQEPCFSVTLSKGPLKEEAVFFPLREDFFHTLGKARTFCWKKDIETLQQKGYGLGGDITNVGILLDNGTLMNPSDIPQECARHKLLDMLGDFSLGGYGLKGHFHSYNPNHSLNYQTLSHIMTYGMTSGQWFLS